MLIFLFLMVLINQVEVFNVYKEFITAIFVNDNESFCQISSHNFNKILQIQCIVEILFILN